MLERSASQSYSTRPRPKVRAKPTHTMTSVSTMRAETQGNWVELIRPEIARTQIHIDTRSGRDQLDAQSSWLRGRLSRSRP